MQNERNMRPKHGGHSKVAIETSGDRYTKEPISNVVVSVSAGKLK